MKPYLKIHGERKFGYEYKWLKEDYLKGYLNPAQFVKEFNNPAHYNQPLDEGSPKQPYLEITGDAYVSKNILSGAGRLTWCVRDTPLVESDTGWAFISDVDDDEFCSDSDNFSVIPYIEVFEIEPVVLWIFEMPIGTDIQLIVEKGKRSFIDTKSGKKIEI